MNFIKHVATAALLVALSASASVFADTVKTNTGNIDTIFNEKAFKNIPQNSQEVKRFVVPTNGIIALEIDGKVNLLSSNGRFVIQGTLYDTWAKKPLTTMSEITKNASIIPMKELNLNIADLRPAVWGDGPKKVMIFTAPGCEACAAPLSALALTSTRKNSPLAFCRSELWARQASSEILNCIVHPTATAQTAQLSAEIPLRNSTR